MTKLKPPMTTPWKKIDRMSVVVQRVGRPDSVARLIRKKPRCR